MEKVYLGRLDAPVIARHVYELHIQLNRIKDDVCSSGVINEEKVLLMSRVQGMLLEFGLHLARAVLDSCSDLKKLA